MRQTPAQVAREQRAVELRHEGKSWRQIADALGMDYANAKRLVMGAMRRQKDKTLDTVARIRKQQSRRLNTQEQEVRKLLTEAKSHRDRMDCHRLLLEIEATRARLYGTNAPTKTEARNVNVYDELTDDEVLERARQQGLLDGDRTERVDPSSGVDGREDVG